MNRFITYIKDILDKDASPSFGRAGAAFVVSALITWGSYIVCQTTKVPDVPYGWVALVGLLWGGSGIKEAYIKGKELINGNNPSN